MEIPNDTDFHLSKNIFNLFKYQTKSFGNFINENSKYILRATFEFQIQHYNLDIKSFVVHLKPTISGKASLSIIDLLFKIRKIAKKT